MTDQFSFRKSLLYLFCISLMTACHNKKQENVMNYRITEDDHLLISGQLKETKPAYVEMVQSIKKNFLRFQQKKWKDSTSLLVYKTITETMPAYWNGTTWDFNGTTQIPGEGNIACGYFVTTLLRDIGYKVNRVKLAQQASAVIVNSTCKNVHQFGNIETAKKYIYSFPDKTIAIVGLDFHTGFLIKDSSGAYFFHSNYINRKGVMKEKLEHSSAFGSSKAFVIGVLND